MSEPAPSSSGLTDLQPAGESHALCDILDEMDGLEEDGDVTLNEVLHAFDDRSDGVLITVIGLLAALPVIGAIPGISITVTVLLLLILARSTFGGRALQLPGRVGRASIKADTLHSGIEKFRPVAGWIDARTGRRLPRLAAAKGARTVIKIAIALLAITMVPLAFVPWGVTPSSFGIVALGLALMARDGLLALIGYAFVLGTAAIGIYFL